MKEEKSVPYFASTSYQLFLEKKTSVKQNPKRYKFYTRQILSLDLKRKK